MIAKRKALKVSKVLLRKTAIKIACGIFGFLAVMIAIITFYGQRAGNFVISVDSESSRKFGIVLSDTEDMAVTKKKLVSNPVKNADGLQYSDINRLVEDIRNNDGFYSGSVTSEFGQEKTALSIVGYTFNLKNTGSEDVDIRAIINITDERQNLSESARVLVFYGDRLDSEYLYMKEDPVPTSEECEILNNLTTLCENPIYIDEFDRKYEYQYGDYTYVCEQTLDEEGNVTSSIYSKVDIANNPYYLKQNSEGAWKYAYAESSRDEHRMPAPTYFTGRTVADYYYRTIQAGESVKITVIIWVQVDDPNFTDEVNGGRIKMKMTFGIPGQGSFAEEVN